MIKQCVMLMALAICSVWGHAQEIIPNQPFTGSPAQRNATDRDMLGMFGKTEEQIQKMFGPPSERKLVNAPNGKSIDVLVWLGIYPDCELVAVMDGGKCSRVLLSLNKPDGTSLAIDESMHVAIEKKLVEWTGSGDWHHMPTPLAKLWKGQGTILLYKNDAKKLTAYVNDSDPAVIVLCP